MLQSLLGIRLVLWTGKSRPRPAAYAITTALTSVEVTNDIGTEGDGFQMAFSLGKDQKGDYTLLKNGGLDLDNRVTLAISLGASLVPLIDGVIYHHQVLPSEQPGMSSLVVSGRDISVLLDLEDTDGENKNESDSTIVERLLAKHVTLGLRPDVTKTSVVQTETQRVPGQHETDLKYIRRLADRNGFVFYIEPVTMGVNRAYWGKEERTGRRQPAISYNLDAYTNVRSLRFANDAMAPLKTDGSYLDPVTKSSNKIPELPSTRLPPLAIAPESARRTVRLRCTARLTAAEASGRAQAAVTTAAEAVSADGVLDTVRYGAVLRPRRIVGVRGAGKAYDGDYFVRSVTHHIEPGVYTQTFSLSRDGTGTKTSRVEPS